MQKQLLKSLLKSKINSKKDINTLIDEFVKQSRDLSAKELKKTLSNLLIFCDQNYDISKNELKKLLLSKIGGVAINFKSDVLEEIYTTFALNEFSSKVGIVFDKIDINAIKAMRKNFYWVQTEYNDKLQTRLKDIIEDAFTGKTLRVDLAQKLRDEFGELYDMDVRYFEGVADHIISQSQNIARINQARKYDVKFYKVMAVMDSKTSEICRSMNGRIIPATHIQNQADNIINAKDIGSKKAAAIWRNEPFLGKELPKSFGLPPYHFRCRTEIVPVWVDEMSLNDKTMRYTDFDEKKEVLSHIDKTGVERKLKKSNTHIFKKHDVSKKDIISALNSITEIAPHKKFPKRSVAISQNGYYMVFEGTEIVTSYKPKNTKEKNNLVLHFKKNAILDKKEIIKWISMKSIFTGIMSGK